MAKETKIPETQVALVTGSSRGIGKAIAHELGARGMTVIGTATTEEGAHKITTDLAENGIKGEGMCLDICDEENITQVLEAIKTKYGVLTVLVNNAGITRDNILLRMKSEEWNQVIDTNLNSVFRLTKQALRPMIKSRYGRIINITSVVGVTGNPGQANYVAAKAGLIGFTKALAQEMANVGVTVNAVAPGFIETDMTANLNDKQHQAIIDMVPMKRMGSPKDIAYAVGFLADLNSLYITGQTLHVNGGMCMV